jgi:copper homeostasis protein
MILEVCVESSAGLEAAVAGGADRVELCSALVLGGLTPSAGFMAEAAGCGVPVMAMIRPRAGDFVWSEAEVAAMEDDVAIARQAGLAGVVLGALRRDGALDGGVLARLVRAAGGMDLTLHRCFDMVPDKPAALEEAIRLGFRRILTSGGGVSVDADRIADLMGQAAGRIGIMPGAGVTVKNAAQLVGLGASELHGSCSVSVAGAGRGVALGFGPAVERRTDAATVRAVKRAMEGTG